MLSGKKVAPVVRQLPRTGQPQDHTSGVWRSLHFDITIITPIMKVMGGAAMSETITSSAEILEPSGVHTLDVRHAMDKLIAAVSPERSHTNAAYGVVIYRAGKAKAEPNIFSATGKFVQAYLKGWNVLSKMDVAIVGVGGEKGGRAGVLEQIGYVKFFVGKAAVSALKQEAEPSPGVYINTAHLDALVLGDLGLPQLPESFRNMPLVMRVEEAEKEAGDPVLGWGNFVKATLDEIEAQETIDRDTVEWRSLFMKNHPCGTARQVADQSTSTAKNRGALASRWMREKKVFAVKYEGQLWFPRFQFQNGEPLRAVGRVIQAYPDYATGWDFAHFFATPNPNIGGRKPLELLKTDSERLVSLARASAQPADAY
jgi:hypothetical protein